MGIKRRISVGVSGLSGAHGGNQTSPSTRDAVVKLKPAGKNLPERRSNYEELGTLTGGRIFDVLGQPVSSGAKVNESTAMGVAAVTACVSLLADMIAKLPIYLYQETKNGPKEITDHPAAFLIGKYPSQLHTSFELRQLMETGKGLGGNGYARVFRDQYFVPRAIEWLQPCDVEPELVDRQGGGKFIGYKVRGESEMLNRYDVIHVRGISRDGICGISPVRTMRENIGTALAQTSAAGSLIRNGAKFSGFLHSDQILGDDIIDRASKEFNANYSGAHNAGRIPVLNGLFKFTAINGMTMADAQFIESRRFELQEVARIYRIPPFMIGDSTASTTWGTGIEQQTLGFLNFCLDPHLVSWEQSLGLTLLTDEEQRKGYFFQFDRDELANVSLEARANFWEKMRNIGVMSGNDIRAKMGEPLLPAEIGDDYTPPIVKMNQQNKAGNEQPQEQEA